MTASVSKITKELNNKILTGGQDILNTVRIVGAVDAIKNSKYSVSTTANLPPAVDNVGRFIYIEDIGEFRYSNGTSWTISFTNECWTILTSDLQMWVWGTNFAANLGDGTTVSRCSPVREICSSIDWAKVSATCFNVAAVKSDGSLWAWGCNNCGATGDGTTVNRCSPVRERCSGTNWSSVSVGSTFMSAIKTSGELWAWGFNGCGMLGDGTVSNGRCSPVREICSATNWCQVSTGISETSAIKTDGSLWGWGRGKSPGSPVREFCSATNWCLVSQGRAGLGLTTAIKTDGSMWVWGCSVDCGAFGVGVASTTSASPVREFCSATNWCDVNVGDRHVNAIKTDGSLWSWGTGYRGALGDGTLTQKCSPVREFCSATNWCRLGKGNSYGASAIKTDGSLWSWGYTIATGIGISDYGNRCSPVRERCSFTDWLSAGTARTFAAAIRAISR